MSKNQMFEAPDISVYQGDVNFKAVRDAGYQQVYLRAGYGKNNVDQRFQRNATACKNLGIPVMIYWFCYALNVEMAAKEAEYAIEQAKKYWSRCPIAFDLEYDTVRYAATKGVRIVKTLATDMAIAFLKKVKEAGYIPVLYYNRDYGCNYFDIARIRREVGGVYDWFALYSSSIPLSELETADVWQYTSKGRIPGVSGNVDLNKVYVDMFDCVPAEYSPTPKDSNVYVKEFQAAANADGYLDDKGRKLDEDGRDGTCTQQVRRKIILKAKYNIWTGSTGEVVRWLKKRLNEILGIDMEVNDKFDWEAYHATKEFQKKFGLKQDGIAGYNTIQMAFYN